MVFGSVSSLLRTLVIGTLAYVALVLLLRLSGKRTLSKWNAFDLVVTVAFGSTMATALLSMENSLVQIVLAFAVLIGLQWIVTWVSVRYIAAERWVKSEPRLLLRQGRLIRENLLRERVTEKEIRSAVRSEGMMALEDVEAVILETNGVFSVIKKRGSSASALADVRGYSDAS